MPMVVMLLLIAMFSLSLWATPPPAGCEILATTGYGRVINLLARERSITPEKLRAMAREDGPTDPFDNERSLDNLFLRQRVLRELNRRETHATWPETRQSLLKLADAMAHDESKVEEAKEQTSHVLAPKLRERVKLNFWSRDVGLFYNSTREEIIAWNRNTSGVTEVVTFSMKARQRDMIEVPAKITALAVIKNGEVWSSINNGLRTEAHLLNGKSRDFDLNADNNGKHILFETPNGQVIFASSSDIHLRVQDLSKGRDLYLKPLPSDHPAVFHVDAKGTVYMGIQGKTKIEIFRLGSNKFEPYAVLPSGYTLKESRLLITSDPEGHLIVVHLRGAASPSEVFKCVDGEPRFLRELPLGIFPPSASFHWDRNGDLILVASRDTSSMLMNLSRPEEPLTVFPSENPATQPPAWFTLPNGQEVLAFNYPGAGTKVITPDGAVLAELGAQGRASSSPLWFRTGDGQNYLAIEVDDEVQIHSVWRTDH